MRSVGVFSAVLCSVCSADSLSPTWSTAKNRLQRDGQDVVLHGLGTTCTEYLVRGIGINCFVNYNWAAPDKLLQLNATEVQPLVDYLSAIASTSVVPAVRIPMTASSWLGVSTTASASNLAKYPKLGEQYQQFISDLVEVYTAQKIVTILDLHWTDDDTEETPMSGRSSLDFWDSVAARFAENGYVFFELYNEPHDIDESVWMSGDKDNSGMLEMLQAVRKHSPNPVVIAGAGGWAYDADSLVNLDAQLGSERNVLYNFHPYMGTAQAGDARKCPAGFETFVQTVQQGTDKPVIITEFGQFCEPTNGAAESCPGEYDGTKMGYDEAVLTIARKHAVSWMPWAWNPYATQPDPKSCLDLNGGNSGTSFYHPSDGKGADWIDLWSKFAGQAFEAEHSVSV